ncbi:MAG: hypothetical protein AAGH78_07615 [Cyanobacteria bacterium P01_H01_bin.58]
MTYYVGENVIIHANVVIASGVVLEALPGSRVIVGEGSCIGSGTVVQAYGGDLVLSIGVSLGRDVLLLGQGSIGQKACIGAESTLVDPQVAASQVIPARSLLTPGHTASAPPIIAKGDSAASASSQTTNGTAHNGHTPAESDTAALATSPAVYGRDQVMQLVHTLFPHRRPLNTDPESS